VQLDLGLSARQSEIQRVFLGWDRPLLPLSVEYFLAQDVGDPIDLRSFLVVTPASRAGARLLEALVLHSGPKRALLPPRVITMGALSDSLIQPCQPTAAPLTRSIVWAEALRSASPSLLETLVPTPPAPNDWPAWLQLGRMFDDLDAELASAALRIGDVPARAAHLEGFRDGDRWQAIAQIREGVHEHFQRLGIDDATARHLDAIATGNVELAPPATTIVLVGCPELTVFTRKILDATRARVLALIHAPASLADRFDQFGAVLPSAWEQGPLGEVTVNIVDDPAQQAACVAATLAELSPHKGLQDVVIGVPDVDVIPLLSETLEPLGVPTRNAAGTPMLRRSVVRLLLAIANHLERQSFSTLGVLARIPDLSLLVESEEQDKDWRVLLDIYQSKHIACNLTDHFVGSSDIAQSLVRRLNKLHACLADLLGSERPLGRWAPAIASFLIRLFGEKPLDPTDAASKQTIAILVAFQDVLRTMAELPDSVVEKVSAATALRVVVDSVAEIAIPEPAEREAIELLGWLELPHDDTAAVIVTGMNDGMVPGCRNADPFLPDGLRHHLGLADNRLRFARDAFLLSALLASRQSVTLMAGRRSLAGDPLAPSRLALCGSTERIAEHVLAFYEGSSEVLPVASLIQPGCQGPCLPVVRPKPLSHPIEAMTVTAFGDYLSCPYRFYLRHVLGLRAAKDDAKELDGRGFGNLAHEVLKDFGHSEVATSTEVPLIREYLDVRLDEWARSWFGDQAFSSVWVQVEQLRARLHAFARWQAQWAASGKRILHAEYEIDAGKIALNVDDTPMYLVGRIDRIDRDESTGTLYVFDYKVSQRPRDPVKDHLTKGEWKNLQLPLYHRMVQAMARGKIELGYLSLSAAHEVQEALAGWSEQQLASAMQVAEHVVRSVRKQVFWPPTDRPFFDDFDVICQSQRLGGAVLQGGTS